MARKKAAKPTPVSVLGKTLESFAVLAGTTITNTGHTILGGNVGVSPGSAITGFPPGIVKAPAGLHADSPLTQQAQAELTAAMSALVTGKVSSTDLSGVNLGGLVLKPGCYHFNSSAQLTGTLTLDSGSDPDASFVFLVGSTLVTAAAAQVHIKGKGPGQGPGQVYWLVGSSATLGADTVFAGNILAETSITLDTGARLTPGRLLARTGAVTLIANNILL